MFLEKPFHGSRAAAGPSRVYSQHAVPRAFDIFGYLSQRSGTALEMLRDEDMWLPLSRAKESTER